MLRPLLIALVAAAAALLTPALADAATTVGSTTGTPDSNMVCGGATCTYFSDGAAGLVVPSDGVLVGWRLNAGSAGGQAALRVLRPAGGGSYLGAGRSATQSIDVGLNPSSGTFATRLPVDAGDVLGIENDNQALYFDGSAGGPTGRFFTGGLGDGATASPDGSDANKRLLAEAILEADADGDGFGDESQDQCPAVSSDQTLPCDSGGGPGGPGGSLPPPSTGRTVNVDAVSGQVLVRVPGSSRFVPLGDDARQIPNRSLIDARAGRVRLTAAVSPGSQVTQTADFYGGIFQVIQARARDAVVEARLAGRLEGCAGTRKSAPGASDLVARTARRRGRRLWGRGRGRFRTRGRRSSTTVRGTTWLVEDRCDGSTRTAVTEGVVLVRDFVRDRTVTVRAGGSYVARPPRR